MALDMSLNAMGATAPAPPQGEGGLDRAIFETPINANLRTVIHRVLDSDPKNPSMRQRAFQAAQDFNDRAKSRIDPTARTALDFITEYLEPNRSPYQALLGHSGMALLSETLILGGYPLSVHSRITGGEQILLKRDTFLFMMTYRNLSDSYKMADVMAMPSAVALLAAGHAVICPLTGAVQPNITGREFVKDVVQFIEEPDVKQAVVHRFQEASHLCIAEPCIKEAFSYALAASRNQWMPVDVTPDDVLDDLFTKPPLDLLRSGALQRRVTTFLEAKIPGSSPEAKEFIERVVAHFNEAVAVWQQPLKERCDDLAEAGRSSTFLAALGTKIKTVPPSLGQDPSSSAVFDIQALSRVTRARSARSTSSKDLRNYASQSLYRTNGFVASLPSGAKEDLAQHSLFYRQLSSVPRMVKAIVDMFIAEDEKVGGFAALLENRSRDVHAIANSANTLLQGKIFFAGGSNKEAGPIAELTVSTTAFTIRANKATRDLFQRDSMKQQTAVQAQNDERFGALLQQGEQGKARVEQLLQQSTMAVQAMKEMQEAGARAEAFQQQLDARLEALEATQQKRMEEEREKLDEERRQLHEMRRQLEEDQRQLAEQRVRYRLLTSVESDKHAPIPQPESMHKRTREGDASVNSGAPLYGNQASKRRTPAPELSTPVAAFPCAVTAERPLMPKYQLDTPEPRHGLLTPSFTLTERCQQPDFGIRDSQISVRFTLPLPPAVLEACGSKPNFGLPETPLKDYETAVSMPSCFTSALSALSLAGQGTASGPQGKGATAPAASPAAEGTAAQRLQTSPPRPHGESLASEEQCPQSDFGIRDSQESVRFTLPLPPAVLEARGGQLDVGLPDLPVKTDAGAAPPVDAAQQRNVFASAQTFWHEMANKSAANKSAPKRPSNKTTRRKWQ